jgi:hypothetical protein
MNVKRLSGILAVVLGIVLIWFSIHVKNKVHNAKEGMNQVSGFFPKDQVGSTVEHKMNSMLNQYDMMIRVSMIGGIILIAGGAYFLFRYRKHR